MPDPKLPTPNLACPLCGGPNACAPAACGSFDAPCWCRDADFPDTLLARIPPEQRGTACVCPACVQAAMPSRAGG